MWEAMRNLDLLRTAVKELRPLFVEWIHTFKESDYFWDV